MTQVRNRFLGYNLGGRGSRSYTFIKNMDACFESVFWSIYACCILVITISANFTGPSSSRSAPEQAMPQPPPGHHLWMIAAFRAPLALACPSIHPSSPAAIRYHLDFCDNILICFHTATLTKQMGAL